MAEKVQKYKYREYYADKIPVKTKDELFDEMKFKDEDDKLLCYSIVDSLESYLAKCMSVNECVKVPILGKFHPRPDRLALRKLKPTFHTLREESADYDTYRKSVRKLLHNETRKWKEDAKKKEHIAQIRTSNRAEYGSLYKHEGKEYAECFIFAISLLKAGEYDNTWKEYPTQYEQYSNREAADD